MNFLLFALFALAAIAWWCFPAWRSVYEHKKEARRIQKLLAAAKSSDDLRVVIRCREALIERLRRPPPGRWGFRL